MRIASVSYVASGFSRTALAGRRQSIRGVVRADNKLPAGTKGDADQAGTAQHELGVAVSWEPIESADACQRLNHVQRTVEVKGEALRPAEAGVARRDRSIHADAIDGVVRRERRPRDVQRAIGRQR